MFKMLRLVARAFFETKCHRFDFSQAISAILAPIMDAKSA